MHHPFSGHRLALCVMCCLTFAGHLVVSLHVFYDVMHGVRVTLFGCIVLWKQHNKTSSVATKEAGKWMLFSSEHGSIATGKA